MGKTTAVGLILLISAVWSCGQESTVPTSVPVDSQSQFYPNTAFGLESFLADAVTQMRSTDGSLGKSAFDFLALPNPEQWFTSNFGDKNCDDPKMAANDCLGPKLAMAYRPIESSVGASFELTIRDFISEGLTNFEAVNYSELCPSPRRIVAKRKLEGNLTTTPFLSPLLSRPIREKQAIYVVWVYGNGKQTTLGFFVYEVGAFRYVGMPHATSTEAYLGRNKATTGAADAHILSDEQVDAPDSVVDPSTLDRIVTLKVVLDKSGTPASVTYVSGPSQLKEVATAEVAKTRFDVPGFGSHGFHPNEFCYDWMAPPN